ncbi:MAG TPA: methylated-DNA--[protein]-cysteine S-methyltransferase [Candidatus Baltobacteraceae bacterium]|nr:methylated-DNA--[protein]-cysteine S-methyltransferase [Candidatus Baltobacteraceae bacterium]
MKTERAAFETPLGVSLVVESDGDCVVGASFSRARPSAARTANDLLREAKRQVDAYFRRRLLRFDLPLKFVGTPFQRDVWAFVAGLEMGQIISYGDLARAIGRPRAHRGVAAAMRRTPIDLFVPAHRVVGSDGSVRGAGRGSMRRKLLAFEGIILR